MTFARREEILSKDILTIADVQELNGMTYQPAAKLVRDIKRILNSQYQVVGKIATSDYIKFFEGTKAEKPKTESKPSVKERKSVKREIPLFRAKEYIKGVEGL